VDPEGQSMELALITAPTIVQRTADYKAITIYPKTMQDILTHAIAFKIYDLQPKESVYTFNFKVKNFEPEFDKPLEPKSVKYLHEGEYKIEAKDPEGGPVTITYTTDLILSNEFVKLVNGNFFFTPKVPAHI
jgi:hypothetical protein